MVKQWFTYAAQDLKMARQSLAFGSEFKSISGFHSQQCAEKAIKGFLAFHKIRFPKTHDLELLAVEVAKVDDDLAKLAKKNRGMKQLAVDYRYPAEQRKPMTVTRARSAIKSAQKIYDECFNRVFGAK